MTIIAPGGIGPQMTLSERKQIVILGGGFGGLAAAHELSNTDADVTIVDRRNHHLFQPLLYQVATAGLSPADIAAPIRSLVCDQKNTRVIMDEAGGIDHKNKTVALTHKKIPYDYLIVATGAKNNYASHPEWAEHAPALKSVEDAIAIRRKILMAFEKAEAEPDAARRAELLNFVIVGGGATGVELAGAIAELSRRALIGDFRLICPEDAHITLINLGPRILSSMPEDLSLKAKMALEHLGVDVMLNTSVKDITAEGVDLGNRFLRSGSVFWAAGVKPTPAANWLGIDSDPQGRVPVDGYGRVAGRDGVFVIGDVARQEQNGKPLPGLAAVAKQQGQYVGQLISQEICGQTGPEPFHYNDKGEMNVIGRSYAVAQIRNFKSAGFLTWLTWCLVHIHYLANFRNKASVFSQWLWSYVTFGKGARLITTTENEKTA